ncbi:MAG: ArnT family glycosyltransferase [Saprospiraceae bacterium]
MSKDKLHQIIFWIAGILLLSYSTIRAVKIPMTIDEATTFLVYVQIPIKDVLLNNPVNTNNHFLNTLLIRLSTWILGDSDFAVRLPALFGHFLYILFSFKLIRAISNQTIVVICGIVLLHLNPYFMDFFGLARGYSLSWGLMMASMFYLYRYIQERKNKYIHWSFVIAGLSVYSILIALNYFLALIVAFNFIFLKDFLSIKIKTSFVIYFFKKNISTILISLVLFALLAYPISRVRANNEFYGEKGSFYTDTILSLVNQSLFGKSYFGIDFPEVLVGIAIVIYLSVIIFSTKKLFSKNNNNIFTGGLVFGILFSVTCWSTIAQLHLLGTPFLADRTALIYFPLFSLLPIFFFSFFDKKKWLQFGLCLIPLLTYSFHFSICANTFTVREWWFDTNTKDVIIYFLENENPEKQVTFGVRAFNSPSFHYYEKVWKLEDQVDMIRLEQLSKNEFYDYYYIEEGWISEISNERYEILKKFDSRILLKLKSLSSEEDR